MEKNRNLPCWKIMNCDASHECMAKKHPETPCWEMASEVNDYRHAMGICGDCVVHMLKAENTTLSDQEIETIITHRANCILM